MVPPSLVSTPFYWFLVVWWWTLELLVFVSTHFPSLVVWEQPLEFLSFSLGCSSLTWPLFVFFIFLDKAVHQMRLYLNLLCALWVRPILDSYHGALLLPRSKVELLFLAIDVEADFSSSNINLCSCGDEERSPKDEGRFLRCFHI